MKTTRFFLLLPLFFLSITIPVTAEDAFPPAPVLSGTRSILSLPKESWRDERYEVFRWNDFPYILIFDTADYAVQDRMLKRLAFFVEKAGFRGRLASDAEIASLHGWNAHDYRAEDLAAFFEAARKSGFPLLKEERELEAILFASGIIGRGGAGEFTAGRGAIVSLSRESDKTDRGLRPRFMAHECFHGLYFTDADFRAFCRRRWEEFPRAAKTFLLSFFEFQAYDTKNTDLVINEFMAHVLQLPVSQISWYFGEFQPNRMISVSPRRRASLPEKEEINSEGRRWWPDIARIFRSEAEAFSAYVNKRWGFEAGRVWR